MAEQVLARIWASVMNGFLPAQFGRIERWPRVGLPTKGLGSVGTFSFYCLSKGSEGVFLQTHSIIPDIQPPTHPPRP